MVFDKFIQIKKKLTRKKSYHTKILYYYNIIILKNQKQRSIKIIVNIKIFQIIYNQLEKEKLIIYRKKNEN